MRYLIFKLSILLLLSNVTHAQELEVVSTGGTTGAADMYADPATTASCQNCDFILSLQLDCFSPNVRHYSNYIYPYSTFLTSISLKRAGEASPIGTLEVAIPGSTVTSRENLKVLKKKFKDHQEKGVTKIELLSYYTNKENTDLYECKSGKWGRNCNLKSDSASKNKYNAYLDAQTLFSVGCIPEIGNESDDVNEAAKRDNAFQCYSPYNKTIDQIISKLEKYISTNSGEGSLIHAKMDGIAKEDIVVTSAINLIEIGFKNGFRNGKKIEVTIPKPKGQVTKEEVALDPTKGQNPYFNHYFSVEVNEMIYGKKTKGQRSVLSVPAPKYETLQSGKVLKMVAQVPATGSATCAAYRSPLMVFFDDKRPRFDSISRFPYDGTNFPKFWPEPSAPGYFLVYKKEKELKSADSISLFGQNNNSENGFEVLKTLDSNKDGVINAKDPDFSKLALWSDSSGMGEVLAKDFKTLKEMGVSEISLSYKNSEMKIVAENRAQSRQQSIFTFTKNGKVTTGSIEDIWLARAQ